MNGPIAAEAFVLVVAPDGGVLFFPAAKELVAGIRRMAPAEREAANYYTLDGEELDIVDPTEHGVWLTHSGRDHLTELRGALARLAKDETASTDPRAVANQVLYNEWLGKWPNKPAWLRRLLRGREAPTVD